MDAHEWKAGLRKLLDEIPEDTPRQRLTGLLARACLVADGVDDTRAALHCLAAAAHVLTTRQCGVLFSIPEAEAVRVAWDDGRMQTRTTVADAGPLFHDA